MAIRCGVDMIEIDRIKKSLESLGASFRDRVFTEREITYCEGKKAAKFESYAARFAAKEAVSKALGTGIGEGVAWKDIEVLNEPSGQPILVLHGRAKFFFEKLGTADISLSLSHCKSYAVAYAVIEVRV